MITLWDLIWIIGIVLNTFSILLWLNAYSIKTNKPVLTWGRLLRIMIVMWIPVISLFNCAIDLALLSSDVSLKNCKVKYFDWLFTTPKIIDNIKQFLNKSVL